MLELDDGFGHAFRQALDAHDVGVVLEVSRRLTDGKSVCQGDLAVFAGPDGLAFAWITEGTSAKVVLRRPDSIVFEEALESYCRMLMRPKGDEP